MCKSFNHNGLYSAPVNSILALCKNYEIFYVNTLVTSHSKPYTVKWGCEKRIVPKKERPRVYNELKVFLSVIINLQ